MKRSLIVGGSMGVVVLLILATMPSVISSNAVKENFSQEKIQLNKLLEKMEESWIPGLFIGLLALISIILWFIPSIIIEFLMDWLARD